jgi:hypothetical protein
MPMDSSEPWMQSVATARTLQRSRNSRGTCMQTGAAAAASSNIDACKHETNNCKAGIFFCC